ncbi:asparagine synthase-related protein [Saliphagus sp. GCM10025334]
MANYHLNLTQNWDVSSNRKVNSHTTSPPSNVSENEDCPGFYAYIEERPDEVVASVDHIRSLPLFYAVHDGALYLSDRSDWIDSVIPSKRDRVSTAEYRNIGHVNGHRTRHPDIKQMLPGEVLRWKEGTLDITRHFTFSYDHDKQKTVENVATVASAAIERLIDYAGGRQIVLPLSGGLDSRIIAALLVKQGHENLAAFTYGQPTSNEVQIAEERADALGIDWHFVNYDHATWREWFRSEGRDRLYDLTGSLAGVPHIEMGPALSELADSPSIENDAIIVPGHSGDMIAGSHLPKQFQQKPRVSHDEVVQWMFDTHVSLGTFSKDTRPEIIDRITNQLGILSEVDSVTASEAVEAWDFRNRQPKYIISSMRAVEAYDFDWYLPLWDRDFVEFWCSVPLSQRVETRLYRKAISDIWTDVTDETIDEATATERSSLKGRGKKLIRGTLAESILRVGYERLQQRRAYGNHPLAWYGVVPQDVFDDTYTGSEHINAFVARERLGEISFDQR